MSDQHSYKELIQRIVELQEQNKDLQAEAIKYRTLFDSFPHGITVSDSDGKVLEANSISEQLLGISKKEHVKRKIDGQDWRIIHSDGTDMPSEEWPGVIALKEKRLVSNFEMGIVKNNDEKIWLHVTAAPIPLKGHGVVITYNDITERREIEAGLEKTRKELEVIKKSADAAHEFADSVINTVREPLISLDQDLRVVTVSRSFYDFFKVKPEETVGQYIYDLGNKQWDIPKLRELLETILPEKTTFDNYEIEHDFETIGHRTMLLNARQIEQAMGKERIILLAIEDITERKQAQKALQESEEKYRTVADFTYNMETWMTPDGMYRYVSPSCERITGYTIAEFLADPNLFIKITHPDDKSKIVEHFHLETNHGLIAQNMGIDFRILTPEGDIRWIGHSCTAVQGRDGRPLGRRESNRDITKRKRAEEEKDKLEDSNRRLQKAESLGCMAGAIAHHFNNKLQVVMGYLEIILSTLPQDDKYMNDLTSVMQAADEAAEVSRLMLTYLGQVTGTREPADLSEICSRSLAKIQNTMPTNVVLETDLLSPGPTIIANSKQIQLILTHLICNSWEATGDELNTIQLSVKVVSSADIPPLNRFPFNWQPEDTSYACLEVRDTGSGIADEDIEKMFDPFFSTKFIGRGLGLPVVLGLVQAYNDVITVESAPGEGSVFRVFFQMLIEKVHFQPDKVINKLETQ